MTGLIIVIKQASSHHVCATKAPLPLVQCPAVCTVRVFVSIQGTESTKLYFFTAFTLGRVLQSCSSFSLSLSASLSTAEYLSVSACHFFFSVCLCTCCLCSDIAAQGIVGKYIFQVPCIAGDGAFKK